MAGSTDVRPAHRRQGKTTGKVLRRVIGGGHSSPAGSRRRIPVGPGREVPQRGCRRWRATTTTTSVPRRRRSTTRSRRTPTWSASSPTTTVPASARRRAIKDNNAADRIPVVAFDSDPQENAALAAGTIDALVVQNPYFFGYQGVLEAGMATVRPDPAASHRPGGGGRRQGQHERPRGQAAARAADGGGRVGWPRAIAARTERTAVLELTDISKAFGPVQALSNVVPASSCPVRSIAWRGRTGPASPPSSGFSPGRCTATRGTYDDRRANRSAPPTPAALRAAGVQAVYQELSLLPHLSVGENMFMGRLPSRIRDGPRQGRPARPGPQRPRPTSAWTTSRPTPSSSGCPPPPASSWRSPRS